VAVGDFNGDAKVDLVVGGFTDWTTVLGTNEDGTPYHEYHDDYFANVLLGNGDGTFRLAGVKSTPYGISPDAGDFDNDGRLDLLTAGGVLPGDFNGDGNLDVLSENENYGLAAPVLTLGNGDGTFRPGGVASSIEGFNLLVTGAGDVNADGKLDVVIILSELDFDTFTTTSSLQVLLSNGDGSFAPIVYDLGTLPGLSFMTSAVLAAFNGDGLPDLATTDGYTPNDGTPGT
jgi:hypothetical protein